MFDTLIKTVVLIPVILMSTCSTRRQHPLPEASNPPERVSCLSLDSAMQNYRSLNTVLVKRKKRPIHLYWNKSLVPMLITTDGVVDKRFLSSVWSGLEQVKALTGLNYIRNNYYGFNPNFFVIHPQRKEFATIKEHFPRFSSCLSGCGNLRTVTQMKNSYNPGCGINSESEEKAIRSWLDVIAKMASSRNVGNGYYQKFTDEDLCGLYLVPHQKNSSVIAKAVIIVPQELSSDKKNRCFKSMLLRSMGLITGYHPSPMHDYQDESMNRGIIGLDPVVHDDRLLEIGNSVLNQKLTIDDFTEQDRFFLRVHYSETIDWGNESVSLNDKVMLSRFLKRQAPESP
jgi:uncharacterized protein YceK